jgi:hypothetical protein
MSNFYENGYLKQDGQIDTFDDAISTPMKIIINMHVHVYHILKIFSLNKERAVVQ